jgi:5-methylcytosine-specific restriction endonuclease McrA
MFLKAKAYQFGYDLRQGKTHKLSDQDPSRTLCGKTLENCPGNTIEEFEGTLDCKVCINSIESRKRYKQWEIEAAKREEERKQRNEQWWQWYNEYLESSEWHSKRRAVIRRASGMCEGCGERRCTQVHHLTYERAGHEMLFDLVAVCDQCHDEIHSNGERNFVSVY